MPQTLNITSLIDTVDAAIRQALVAAAIRAKAQIPANAPGAAYVRYFGKFLMQAADSAVVLLRAALAKGAFPSITFTADDLSAAIQRVKDLTEVDAKFHDAAASAHAECLAATESLATMVYQITQAADAIQNNPFAPQEHKDAIQSGGKTLFGTVQERNDFIRGRRTELAGSRAKDVAIGDLTTKDLENQTQAAVLSAQDKLKLQMLTGEPLKPQDLVVTPDQIHATEPAPPPAPKARAKGGKGGKKSTQAKPRQPTSKARRSRSR